MAKGKLDIEAIKTTVSYSPHELQTLDVYRLTESPFALWIIFIHGGAWRDTRITSSVGEPLIRHLLRSPLPMPVNAASLNYRLSSAHPSSVRHPDHLDDVQNALAHLREHYGMREHALIGHSAGATLAFQTLAASSRQFHPPRAVFGVEGIYDLAALVAEYPDYREFVEGAFGDRELAWPPPLALAGYAGLVVLAQSDGDELLSWRQTEEMKGRCEDSIGVGGSLRVVKVVGRHDEVLSCERMAGVVERYLRELV